jgi:hypothetical protein
VGISKERAAAQQKREDKDHLPGDIVAGRLLMASVRAIMPVATGTGRHPAAVITVGHMPGVQHKQHARGKLDQAHPTQVHHIAGQLVEVPADGHGEHLKCTGGKDAGKPEGDKRAVMT